MCEGINGVYTENLTLPVEKVVDMIDNLKDFKGKFQKANDKTKQYMIKLMTNRIVATAYTGDNPKVDRKLSRTLEFEWNDEFSALFEMGVIKKLDKEAKEWTDKHGPKTPGSNNFLSRKKGNRLLFPEVIKKVACPPFDI